MSVEATTMAGRQIGRSLPRLEAREKVTGRAEYTHTMRVPGMLVGKIFRSTVAHGRIKSIHTAAAKKIPGVIKVVSYKVPVRPCMCGQVWLLLLLISGQPSKQGRY